MAFPFVAARWYTRNGMTEARAILWHMAEGGGTVPHLQKTPGNNSAHFVVEYSGRIVQMVALRDASHSAHVSVDADDSDAEDCGIYSAAVARQVLGEGWSNINRYVVAVEVEGFRKDGPNAAQRAAIVELYAYLVGRLPSLRGNLGHRDVQDYKGCPGCKFPWDSINGHGLFKEEGAEVGLDVTITNPSVGRLSIPKGTDSIRLSTGGHYAVGAAVTRDAYRAQIAPDKAPGYLVDMDGDVLHFIRHSSLPAGSFAPQDCSKAVEDLAAARARITRAKEALG